MQRTWIILGATSIIAEHFAHFAASAGNNLRLVGRDREQLEIIAQDIQLRYKIFCDLFTLDMSDSANQLAAIFKSNNELDLFIAHSDFTDNSHLSLQAIEGLIKINVLSTALFIHTYLSLLQSEYNLVFLSSVASCRGRAKNSLYGGTKAAIEVFLQGLQQEAAENKHITIARLGFIDTRQTYGVPGIFYAAPPEKCAKACWDALHRKKRLIYFPGFWRVIMAVINRIPFFIYKKMTGM